MGRLAACTTRDSHPLDDVKTAVILARRHDRERLQLIYRRDRTFVLPRASPGISRQCDELERPRSGGK